jgi:hypothetical protein
VNRVLLPKINAKQEKYGIEIAANVKLTKTKLHVLPQQEVVVVCKCGVLKIVVVGVVFVISCVCLVIFTMKVLAGVKDAFLQQQVVVNPQFGTNKLAVAKFVTNLQTVAS